MEYYFGLHNVMYTFRVKTNRQKCQKQVFTAPSVVVSLGNCILITVFKSSLSVEQSVHITQNPLLYITLRKELTSYYFYMPNEALAISFGI